MLCSTPNGQKYPLSLVNMVDICTVANIIVMAVTKSSAAG